MYITGTVTFTDPSSSVSATYYQQYFYAGATMNLQGRGFQGFGAQQVYDSRSTLWETRNVADNFPYNGMLITDAVAQDSVNAKLVHVVNNNVAVVTLGTANNQRYIPYINDAAIDTYEVGGAENGALITHVNTIYSTPDNYGNLANVSTTTTDEDTNSPYSGKNWTSTVATSYTPNVSTWCLSLPTQMTVTNTAPGASTLTRTQAYTPDYTYCRQTQQVTEPSSTAYKVTTGFGYDSFGNVNAQTVTGIGMSARTTSINWGSSGQFVNTITNPLSQISTLVFDPNTGMQTSQKDPNNIMISWAHDDFARKITETRPDGTSTAWQYNDCASYGGCILCSHALALAHSVTNADGSLQTNGTTYFDPLDRPLMANNLMSSSTTTYSRNEVRYDPLGRVTQQALPCIWTSDTAACAFWIKNYYVPSITPVNPFSSNFSSQAGASSCTHP